MTLETVLAVLSTFGWIGSLLLVLIYHHTARWWQYAYGRALFILVLVTFLFFTTSMLYNIFGPDYPGRDIMRIVNLLLTVAMVWYLLITLVRGGAAARRERRRKGPRGDGVDD